MKCTKKSESECRRWDWSESPPSLGRRELAEAKQAKHFYTTTPFMGKVKKDMGGSEQISRAI
jgi:hypothetical protein